jgi:L-lactate dehydrogenase complex protein LldG
MQSSSRSSEARSEIFESVRRNLAASAPFDRVQREHSAQTAKSVETAPPVSAVPQEVSPTGRFRENLVSVGGNCEIVRDRAAAARLIQAIAEKCGARKIAVSDAALIGELAAPLGAGAEILINASKEALFECDLGITGAQFGAAETGTLVLESDREFHRLTSLIPPVHVCVLEAKNIRQTLGEVLELLEKDISRTITFITGPSRTSDIELTLAIGVHGPAQLFVILIDEELING